MIRDLVCGMQIAKNSTQNISEYRGNIFYFCSPGCKKKFDENPEKYLKKG